MKIMKASLALAFALAAGACAENSGPPDTSEIRVIVRDLSGSGVGSADIEMFRGAKSLATATTNFSGLASIETNETGDLELVVTPPSGYRVPSNQKTSIMIALQNGQVKDVAFVIEKIPSEKPPPSGGGTDF